MAFGAAGTYILVPRFGWAVSAWGSALGALFGASWILVIDPQIDVRLDIATVTVLSGALVGTFIGLRKGNTAAPLAAPPLLATSAVLLPALITGVLFYGASVVRGMPLGWAMQGDAQFNTVLSRQIGASNGAALDDGQVLSLAQGLMAMVHQPGRSAIPVDDLLLHDIARQANLWMLFILLSSVLAGTIAERVLRDASIGVRLFGIVASGLLPLAWHITGYALNAGFYNVSLTLLTLELTFYFWLAFPRQPLWRSSILLALGVVMLGAWTPMAVIPAVLASWSAWEGLRTNPDRRALVVWAIMAAQFAAFVVTFVLPGFLEKSDVLSVSGSIIPLDRHIYVAVSVAAILMSVFLGNAHSAAPDGVDSARAKRHFATGVALVALAAAAGTAFLVFQNRHLPDFWTYYPIKFAWIAMEMLVLLLFLGTVIFMTGLRARRLAMIAAGVSVSLLLLSVLQLNPPQQGGTTSAFPILALAKNDSPADATLPLLTTVSGERVFFYRYSTLEQDTFMNQWQFQITAEDEFTPIREFAYTAVSSVTDACDAARAWGGDVTVVTSRPIVARGLDARCPDLLTAVVRPSLE